MYVDACCNSAGSGELVSLMPRFATAHSLADYPKLSIKQVKPILKPDMRTISLPYRRGGQAFNQLVQITTTSCNYGGSRYWFICPDCHKRVGVLYRQGNFKCRHCLGVNYQSQLQQPQNRLFERLNALRERLGWQGGIIHGYGEKPKGMHEKTYKRLLGEYIELERLASGSITDTLKSLDLQLNAIAKDIRKLTE